MTTWIIEYGDEAGNQNTRATDSIADVHETLATFVTDKSELTGYAGQTDTWRGYEPRDANGFGPGNWSLSVTNLDTHDRDGYERETEQNTPGGDVL